MASGLRQLKSFVCPLLITATLLFAAAWIVSFFGSFSVVWHSSKGDTEIVAGFVRGRLAMYCRIGFAQTLPGFHFEKYEPSFSPRNVLGEFYVERFSGYAPVLSRADVAFAGLEIPIPCILIGVTFIAYLIRNRFRYSIRSVLIMYLVVSAICAWYFRVQYLFARSSNV